MSQAAQTPAAQAPAVSEKKAKKPKTGKKVVKAKTQKFQLDCSGPVADDIFDIANFEKFLHDSIKVNGKTGVLGESVSISRDGATINVTAKVAMAKRYLKYLTKKFLKKQLLRDYIRVIAKSKTGYTLKYFNFNAESEESNE